MKYYGFLLLTVALIVSGCATPEINEVMLATQLQDAQQAINNAADLEAEALVPVEFGRAVKLLNFAQDSQEGGDLLQSAEFAYQAELVAQIAGVRARQYHARQEVVNIREQTYQHIIKANEHELEIGRIREAILEEQLARTLNARDKGEAHAAQLSTEITDLKTALRQAELRLALAKAHLSVNVSQYIYPAIVETADYERVQAALTSITNLIEQGEFLDIEEAIRDAEGQANGLYQLSERNLEVETAASLKARIAVAQTEVIIERAESLNAEQHAPQQFQEASAQLRQAKQELAANRYEQAEQLAQQARQTADETVVIAESAEFRHRAQQEFDRLKGDAQLAVEALKEKLQAQAETKVPQLEAELYELANSAYERASTAWAAEEYDTALAAAAEGVDYLERAVLNTKRTTSAKSDLVAASRQIPKATVINQSDHVLIRIRGNAFAHGSMQLQGEFSGTFTALAKVLRNADFRSYPVRIEVHTSALGNAAVNQNLSTGRADVIKGILVADGNIDPKRLKAVGFGETRPVVTEGANKEEQNRRIDVIIQTN